MPALSTRVQRFLLPGFAFKALVIGGGYATGRELATFFLPSGPLGGLWAMLLSALVWSIVCTLTFLFAFQTASRDYGTFFRSLLGPLWPAFEVAYGLTLIVVLAVYSAAAGAIGNAMFGWAPLVGSLLLMICVTAITAYGNVAVERLFKYVTIVLYGTYLLLAILVLSRFGQRCIATFSAGLPSLPSDYVLERLNMPALRALFELMVFAALLESAAGGIHAFNERTAHAFHVARGHDFPFSARLALTCAVLAVSVYLAARIGLVSLIARGYTWLAVAILLIYVLPLVTLGTWRLLAKPASP